MLRSLRREALIGGTHIFLETVVFSQIWQDATLLKFLTYSKGPLGLNLACAGVEERRGNLVRKFEI